MKRWLGGRPLEDDVQRVLTWIRTSAGGLTHRIRSATHSDTIAGIVARGDLLVGESTPRWTGLALGADTYVLRSDGTDAVWADPAAWVPIAPVAQNDMIIADATPAWSIVTGPAAQYERLASGGSPFVPLWTVNLWMADDAYIGIPGGGRLVFDSTPSPDQIEVTAADLYLQPSHGIIHGDGVTAGYVLRADGTRYIPANPATTLPLAPVAQGDIIIANGTPAWSVLTLGAAAGYALVSTATAAEWDQTPTWTGLHTFTADPAIEIDVSSNEDAVIIFDADGADRFAVGVHYPGMGFAISAGSTLGTNDRLTIDSSGSVDIPIGLGLGSGSSVTGGDLAMSGELRCLDGIMVGSYTTSPSGSGNVEITKSVGDPLVIFDIGGTDYFSLGVDDTDGDAFKISGGGSLGASDYIVCVSSEVQLKEDTDIDGVLTLQQQGEPSDPSEGAGVLWLSNGTGAGDAGDLMWKSTESAVTKTETLIDFSGI